MPDPDMSLSEALRRKESALARKREFDLDIARGKVLPLAVIQPMWSRIIAGLRNSMMSVPSKLRLRMPHLSEQDFKEIEEVIRDVLTAAALNRGFKPTIEASNDD